MCRQHATYYWKAPNEDYNFASNLISVRGLYAKLWAPKVTGVHAVGILGLPLRSPRTKNYLNVGPMERHKGYYNGEGGGFPQMWAVMSLVCPSCSWFDLAPKVL